MMIEDSKYKALEEKVDTCLQNQLEKKKIKMTKPTRGYRKQKSEPRCFAVCTQKSTDERGAADISITYENIVAVRSKEEQRANRQKKIKMISLNRE